MPIDDLSADIPKGGPALQACRIKKARPMKHQFLALTLGVGSVLLSTSAVYAQSRNCASREAVVERLGTKYGESRQSIGLGTNNAVVEVFASLDTGTWTITVTMTNGMTCIVAAGQAFETLAEAPAEGGNDA